MTCHWRSKKKFWALRFNGGAHDGELVGVYFDQFYKPPKVQALTTALFATRRDAREFISDRFWYGRRPTPLKVEVKFVATD